MVKIVTGGQTGVDRAALDVAVTSGIDYGGWCPRGGWAEDFPEPPGVRARFPQLRETPLADPAQRTAWNIRDSDAVLILVGDAGASVSAGTMLATQLAEGQGKPRLIVDLSEVDAMAGRSNGSRCNGPVSGWDCVSVLVGRGRVRCREYTSGPGLFSAPCSGLNARLGVGRGLPGAIRCLNCGRYFSKTFRSA